MEVKFTTTAKKVELANYLIALAVDAAKSNEKFRDVNGVSLKDIALVDSFRKQLLKAYFKLKK